MYGELGNVQIFFGIVKTVQDDKKICRLQISIDNYTEKIPTEQLPWYFPWYGLNFLPVIGDVVSVIVFDENFSTAFYGKKVNLELSNLSDTDYVNYLEIFKRQISDKNVQLTYTESKGIQIINSTSEARVEIDRFSLFSEANSIVITKDRIDIGNKNQEATILGDKGVDELHDIILHQKNTISAMLAMFNAVFVACISPMTFPIAAALLPLISTYTSQLTIENKKVDVKLNTIQSKKVFIE